MTRHGKKKGSVTYTQEKRTRHRNCVAEWPDAGLDRQKFLLYPLSVEVSQVIDLPILFIADLSTSRFNFLPCLQDLHILSSTQSSL